jgi:hypothetical protein
MIGERRPFGDRGLSVTATGPRAAGNANRHAGNGVAHCPHDRIDDRCTHRVVSRVVLRVYVQVDGSSRYRVRTGVDDLSWRDQEGRMLTR